MKKSILTLFLAIMATVGLYAQQISVVSPGGSTALYKTLAEAINEAEGGSVIYLPGGGFPLSDEVKITKKLTIIGIGHKSNNDNPDSNSTISGNLFFNQGSDGSTVMGCYITGTIHIGNDGNGVDDILIRYNFINSSVQVENTSCLGTTINQNYINNGVDFHGTSGTVSNNVLHWIVELDNGFILNNIIVGSNGYAMYKCDQTIIKNNVIFERNSIHYGGNCVVADNMSQQNWGDGFINVGSVDWGNVFVDYKGVTPMTNFHFKEEYAEHEGKVGIYHGTFNDNQLAPVPHIVAKRVDTETDASGKLNVKIRVKAGQ